MVIISGLFLMN